MSTVDSSNTYTYRVDKNDLMMCVSENWQCFEEQNAAGSTCLPRSIIGTSLWSHISDWETRHLYEIILDGVRERQRRAMFPFRCDSPDVRRFLILAVTPMPEQSVLFESQIVRSESRLPVEILKTDIARSEQLLRICSMCKRIALSGNEWVEVEVAVQELELFQKSVMPGFTHGVCQDCFRVAMAELQKP